MTDIKGKVLVVYEGQQHWLPETIANDDTKLRAAFTPLCPELANAEIERQEGQPIRIIRRAGSKGNGSPLEQLTGLKQISSPNKA